MFPTMAITTEGYPFSPILMLASGVVGLNVFCGVTMGTSIIILGFDLNCILSTEFISLVMRVFHSLNIT